MPMLPLLAGRRQWTVVSGGMEGRARPGRQYIDSCRWWKHLHLDYDYHDNFGASR